MTETMTRNAVDPSEAVERIRPVVEDHRQQAEEARQLPDAVVDAMRQAGLLRLWTPKEYGGAEVDLPVFMRTAESMARVDSAAGWILATAGAGTLLTAFITPESAREVYADGPDVILPGASAPNGRAVPVDG